MIDAKILNRVFKENPEEIFNSVLTKEEQEALHGIKHELGLCIKWGALRNHAAGHLLSLLDTVIFIEDETTAEGLVKRSPLGSLFPPDQSKMVGLSEKVDLYRKYVLLHLFKKLLGTLKTHVNQKLSQIDILDDDTWQMLESLIKDNEPSEEEMDLVGADDDLEITAKVDANGEVYECPHARTVIRQVSASVSASGMDELREVCKDCGEITKRTKLSTRTYKMGYRQHGSRRTPAPCQHRSAHWKPGEEGKTAVCTSCLEELDEDKTKSMNWESVGLEPYGDNPEQDEIQYLLPVHLRKESEA